MQKYRYILLGLLAIGMLVTGFQCSSADITSAKLYIQQKNTDKAIESLKREISKNPKSDEGYFLLGVLFAEKEIFDTMLVNFDKSLEISKKFEKDIKSQKLATWGSLFNKGVAFYQKANKTQDVDSGMTYFQKSAESFEMATTIQPDSPNTYKYLAYVYLSMGRYEEAIAPLNTLIKLDDSPEGYRFIGEIYYEQGQKMKDKFETSKDPADQTEAQLKFEQAVEILEKGKTKYPNDPEILLFLSNAYIAAGKTDIALSAFKEGVTKEPTNKLYRYNYGVLLLGVDDFQGAEQQFLKALEIDPEYINADYNLAITYVKWGTKMAKDAETAGKEDPEVKVKYNQAIPYFEKYLAVKPDDAAAWELLGKVYSVLGRLEDATKAFEKADANRK